MKIILIAGPSGSGKTTVRNKLIEKLGKDKCSAVSIDDYYRDLSHISDMALRKKTNFDDPASIEKELLLGHVKALLKGQVVHSPKYDFKTHTRTGEHSQVTPNEYLLIEGVFALEDDLYVLGDVTVFIDTDADVAYDRRQQRDTKERGRTLEQVREQYFETVRPMRIIHIDSKKQFADVVIYNNSHNFNIDISPIMNFIEQLQKDEITYIKENVAAITSTVTSSVTGWFSNWRNYAVTQMERADQVAHDYLMTDAHPDAKAPALKQ